MKTQLLAECPDLVPTVAYWLHEEFSHIDQKLATQEGAEHQIAKRLNPGGCPITVLTFEGNIPTGTASLVECDLEPCAHLTPWLTDVYVQPFYRGHGHGSHLIHSITKHAKRNKYRKLHLYTENRQAFYKRLGWVESIKLVHLGCPVSVMELTL